MKLKPDSVLMDDTHMKRVERAESAFYTPGRPRVGFACEGPSMTREEFASECDINQIMARYEKTGVINHYSSREPQYMDLGDVPDLQTALNVLQEGTDAFMRLPASIRKRFGNDPHEFIAFSEDPANLGELRNWGLAKPAPVEPAPARVEVVNLTQEAPTPSKTASKVGPFSGG